MYKLKNRKTFLNAVRGTLSSPLSLYIKLYRTLVKKSSWLNFTCPAGPSHAMKGQAVVEYILMLVVTLTLVIGVATKLIPQLRDFMQNYAGAYVVCLLETGELPPPLTLSLNPQCSIENMEAAGRLNASGGSSGTTGSSGSGQGNQQGSTNQNSNTPAAANRSGGSSSSPRQISGANTGTDGNSNGSAAGGSQSKSGDKLAAAANSASNGVNNLNNLTEVPYAAQKDNGSGISGYVKNPNSANLKDKNIKPTAKLKKDNKIGGENLRKGSFSAPISKNKERGLSNADDVSLGFQFGKYLRYFIIAGLLLALILMVGTQINSLRKSWGS